MTLSTGGVLAVLLGLASADQDRGTELLRFPDIHDGSIVFTHGGDLWTVSSSGGTARRLTAHPGIELFAKYSPDGEWIAFTGQYEGDEQVYVMPAEGGEPKRLTHYPALGPLPSRWGYDHQVHDWSPDGTSVLFRGGRDQWSLNRWRLYTVSASGGTPEALPMPTAGAGTFSPDGKRLFYSPLWRDFRTWKRYEGGWAQDLYLFDLERKTSERVTQHKRTDRDPMWIGDTLVFVSDRNGRLNLYRRPVGGGDIEALTSYTEWDVRWPSASSDGKIVYELGGILRVFNLDTKEDVALRIEVPNDGLKTRPRVESVGSSMESFNPSPMGSRVLVVARGDLFDAPTEEGLTRNLTSSSAAHDREAQWSKDGSKIAFVSDRDGEEQLWTLDLSTRKLRALTEPEPQRLYEPRWSPTGEHIAFRNHRGELFVVEVAKRKLQMVAESPMGTISDYRWSPHGGHLAFSIPGENSFRSLYVWTTSDSKTRQITDSTFHETEPRWDPEGKYLYFLADHDFRPEIDPYDFNYANNRRTSIYAFALRADVEHPFPPKNDEDEAQSEGESKEENSKAPPKKDSKKPPITIEFDGLATRVARIPHRSGNLSDLEVTSTHIYFVESDGFYLNRPKLDPRLTEFDAKSRKARTVMEGVQSYSTSWDNKRLIARTKGGLHVIEVGKTDAPKKIPLDGLETRIDPRQEWTNIFHETWRRFRDHFYVPNLHGVDWEKVRGRYEPLLDHVAHRSDLNYLLGEMVAELNVSHAYVSGGDENLPPRPPASLPGARFERDEKTGRSRIAKIFRGQNEEDEYRVPLRDVGVEARVGDFVMAVNGQPLGPDDNIYAHLRRPSSHPLELVLNDKPRMTGARTVVIRPRASERSLVYHEWVSARRTIVEQQTNGEVGYLHIPNMGAEGLREFAKWYYPQLRKRGLVIDVRGNGGGFVSQMLIRRLQLELLGTGFARHDDIAYAYPGAFAVGPKVCLLDETSASDGDIFPAAFKEAEIGPLIGKRSWGGVVGITDHGPLIDGGSVYVPEFSTNDPEGRYVIEGYGVDPDIEVDNPPSEVIEGRDPQLQRAIQEIQRLRKEQPDQLPKRPPDPVKAGPEVLGLQ
ncbi:MAG: S41 family peptidase [Myxococcota bacterium]